MIPKKEQEQLELFEIAEAVEDDELNHTLAYAPGVPEHREAHQE
jgi:hypothetical protein